MAVQLRRWQYKNGLGHLTISHRQCNRLHIVKIYCIIVVGLDLPAMVSMTMTSMQGTLVVQRLGSVTSLRALPVRPCRGSRSLAMKVSAAVKFDYDTKVFKKELVKFADTEEYIYR